MKKNHNFIDRRSFNKSKDVCKIMSFFIENKDLCRQMSVKYGFKMQNLKMDKIDIKILQSSKTKS